MSRFDGAIGDDEYPRALLEQNLRRMIAGKRGKKILRDLEQALLVMPSKRLIAGQLIEPEFVAIGDDDEEEKCVGGEVCLLGVYALAKGQTFEQLLNASPTGNIYDYDEVDAWDIAEYAEKTLGMPSLLALELEWVNDDKFARQTPEERYDASLAWVRHQLEARTAQEVEL